ncbi:MAG: PHP domain-containing protein [Acidobacteria bacterium]|nr:PHP domain-containing protein [Acidobacteriota bacterium]MBU4306696.1 PHP domain-containing protein [Acidobacteriota bacterium]MBU4405323.1 PHP domain-containing protein [Acidobacteriota bacterium]MCG2810129.1 PHP domain-containing protein [Candidatus Aminicenantes bacterium]
MNARMKIAADLHIHSTLSPCASLEMSPAAIVRRAKELALDLIAVTDHNSMENSFVTASLGVKMGLRVLYGLEAQTSEDVHCLCLFEDLGQAAAFNVRIYNHLPAVRNEPEYFGDQVVVDEQDNIVRHEDRLLLNALKLTIPELLELVREHGGTVIPAHVESASFGLLVNMGMVPRELRDSVLEISHTAGSEDVRRSYPELNRFSLITNSDAHFLKDIGCAYTVFQATAPSLPALIKAARAGAFDRVYRKNHG